MYVLTTSTYILDAKQSFSLTFTLYLCYDVITMVSLFYRELKIFPSHFALNTKKVRFLSAYFHPLLRRSFHHPSHATQQSRRTMLRSPTSYLEIQRKLLSVPTSVVFPSSTRQLPQEPPPPPAIPRISLLRWLSTTSLISCTRKKSCRIPSVI